MAMTPDLLSDDELIERFKKGDAGSFEALVYRYKNSLYQYIMALVRDEGAAGDLFQEVFINFYKRVEQYQAQGKFKSWLFTSARNRVLNFFRNRDPLASLDESDEDGNPVLHDSLPGSQPLPLEELENRELGVCLRNAALRLPPAQREIIYLRQYLPFKEISVLVARPLGTVLAQYQRGVKKMQQMLLRQEVL